VEVHGSSIHRDGTSLKYYWERKSSMKYELNLI
jgi:hypothetical protein